MKSCLVILLACSASAFSPPENGVAVQKFLEKSSIAREPASEPANKATEATAGKHEQVAGPLDGFYHLPLVLSGGLAAFFIGGKVGHHIPQGIGLSLCLCAVYITFSVTIDIFIKTLSDQTEEPAAKSAVSSNYAFNPICMVIVTEASKLIISALLLGVNRCGESEKQEVNKSEDGPNWSDAFWLAAPAAIFTANNVLVFKALGSNDTAVFGVFRDTMILWTAAMWKFVFRTDLGQLRMLAILIIFVGLVVNQASQHVAGDFSWAFLWVLAMTWCNAMGSVSNEYALKRNKGLDINIQNMILYSLCIFFSCVLLGATDPARFTSVRHFFGGFSNLSWSLAAFQAIAGLLVSRLLKYTDSIMKTSATCLRGPIFVCAAPFFVKSELTEGSMLSTLMVAAGCFYYLSQGPLTANKASA